jgi:hypothetical protein
MIVATGVFVLSARWVTTATKELSSAVLVASELIEEPERQPRRPERFEMRKLCCHPSDSH